MKSSPFPRYLVPPRSKYSPQHHVRKHPQLPFLRQCERPSFTPIQKKPGKIIVLYILIFKSVDNNLEDKRFCTENNFNLSLKLIYSVFFIRDVTTYFDLKECLELLAFPYEETEISCWKDFLRNALFWLIWRGIVVRKLPLLSTY